MGVVRVDEGARDEGGDRSGDVEAGQRRFQGVEHREADRPLRLGAAPVERHGWHDVGGDLVLDEQVADLGAVAVGEDDLVPCGDELGDVLHRLGDGAHLIGRVRRAVGRGHGVSAECHENPHASTFRTGRHTPVGMPLRRA